MLATIEDILRINHLGMNDANAAPMSEAFTRTPNMRPYDVIIPGVLCRPPVHPDLVPECQHPNVRKTAPVRPLRTVAWWSANTRGWNWDIPDANNADAFNRLVWAATFGAKPYPESRDIGDQ
jgi:DNA-binding beta-propeller fold protein YncE